MELLSGNPRTSRRQNWRRTIAFGAVLLAAQLTFSTSASAQDAAVPNLAAVPDEATALADLVNQYRTDNGLDRLIVDPEFSANSQGFANALMRANPPVPPPPGFLNGCPTATLFHDDSASIFESAPGSPSAWGENVGYTCSGSFADHVERLFEGLRRSPSHNAAMLDPRWTHMASAAARWGHSTVAVNRFAQLPAAPAHAVSAVVSCLSGSGRVDFTVTNRGANRESFVIRLGLIRRTTTLNPGQSGKVTITGRSDGTHAASAAASAGTFWNRNLAVACTPSPAEGIGVTVSCLGGAGRVDVTIMDRTGGSFDVRVGTVARRVHATGGVAAKLVVTGRPEGDLGLTVTRSGQSVHRSTHHVDCVKDQTQPVVVTTSCLAGNGRIDVSIRNDGPTRSYQLEVGTVRRTVSVEGGTTVRSSVTGRPNGPHAVKVAVAGTGLHASEPRISC